MTTKSTDSLPVSQPAPRLKISPHISTMLSSSFLAIPMTILPRLHPKDTNNRPRSRHVSQPNMGSSGAAKSSPETKSSNTGAKFPARDFPSDLTKLKTMVQRLNLQTRRASYVAWLEELNYDGRSTSVYRNTSTEFRAQMKANNRCTSKGHGMSVDESIENDITNTSLVTNVTDDTLTNYMEQRIQKSLDWVQIQLRVMKDQDQILARELLTLYHEIHKLRLSRSCQEHRELLDELQCDLEELQEFSNVLELPETRLLDTPLQHVGVTRLNLSSRRFSTC